MKALPWHDSRLRIVGSVLCLSLLLYGAVSVSKPHHSYLLSFSFAGQIEGEFQSRIHLDDGSLIAPVTALRGAEPLYVVALPTRTIRGIRLITGKGAGVIRNLQVHKVAVPIRDLSADRLHETGSIYRKLNFGSVTATEGLNPSKHENSSFGFQTQPGADRASLDFDLQGPLYLLQDMHVAWVQRLAVILIIGAALLWIFSRPQISSLANTSPRMLQFLKGHRATVMGCGLWSIAAFSVYFVYAGRLSSFGWNITEFIIANQLQDVGRYALGATYPTAVWRPIGPTFIVLAIDALVRDPVFTYQLLSASAMASFITSIYLLNRVLFGQLLANAGAALAFATPAVTVSLINHAHAISHLCFLLVAGPTLLAAAICIMRTYDGKPSAPRWLWIASVGWVFCYLCRSESMFMAACFFLLIIFLAMRRKRVLWLLPPLASFIVVFLGFNIWASASAERDDLFSRKMIYQFYASQGWTDLFDARSRTGKPSDDFELHGYVHAIELYGTPAENSETLTFAIARNPKAFAARIVNNFRHLVDLLVSGRLLSLDLSLLLFLLPLGLVFLKRRFRLLAIFGLAIFSTVGIFTIFHIDDRYLTIAVPAAIFLGSLSAHGLTRMPIPARIGQNAFAGVVLVIAVLHLPAHLTTLSYSFARERLDLSAFRLIGEGFSNAVRASSAETAGMIVHLDIPLPPALKSNAILLLFPYFARTSLLLPGSSELYPRDRLFSLPECPATHAVVLNTAIGSGYDGELGRYFVPQVGGLGVFRLAVPDRPVENTFAARFCAGRSGD